MANNNIFREAKELLNTKPISQMTQEEVSVVKAATTPLLILPHLFIDMTVDQGLEELARLVEPEKLAQEEQCLKPPV